MYGILIGFQLLQMAINMFRLIVFSEFYSYFNTILFKFLKGFLTFKIGTVFWDK